MGGCPANQRLEVIGLQTLIPFFHSHPHPRKARAGLMPKAGLQVSCPLGSGPGDPPLAGCLNHPEPVEVESWVTGSARACWEHTEGQALWLALACENQGLGARPP